MNSVEDHKKVLQAAAFKRQQDLFIEAQVVEWRRESAKRSWEWGNFDPTEDEELDDSWATFMKQRRLRRRNEARRTGGRRGGRPIDPNSYRQQELAARAAAGSNAVRRGRPVNPQRQQELAERAARREERQAD